MQDIAKCATDPDRRTPSIRNIVLALDEPAVVAALRENFAVWRLPPPETLTDPAVVEALKKLELREEAQRRTQFDEHYRELLKCWNDLCSMPALGSFRIARDKLIAHTEIHLIADKYQSADISGLGITSSDLPDVIAPMQRSVELVGLIVRNAAFPWEMLDRQLSDAARWFWADKS